MQYTYHAGEATLREVNYRHKLYADGDRLAIDSYGFTYLLEGFAITALEMTNDIRGGGAYLELTIRSRGPVKSLHSTEIAPLFVNANELSVDELLKIIYERMEQRQPDPS